MNFLKKFHCLLLSILMVLLIGCANTSIDSLHEADALMCERPDSALKILDAINYESLNSEQKLRHALLTAKAIDKSHLEKERSVNLEDVMKAYHNRGDSLETQSLFYYARYLDSNNQVAEALFYYLLSYDLACNTNDNFYAGLSARHLSKIYGKLYSVDEQLKWAEIEQQKFSTAGYRKYADWADIHILAALFKVDPTEAKKTIKDIRKKGLMQEKYYEALVLHYEAANLYDLKEFDKSIATYDRIKELGIYPLTSTQWCQIAECNLGLNKIKAAEEACDSAKVLAVTNLDSLQVKRIEAKIYAAKGEYKEAYEAADRFGHGIMADGDQRMGQPFLIELISTLRENYQMEKTVNQLLNRYLWLSIAALIVTLIAIISFVLWRLTKKRLHKQEVEVIEMQAEAIDSDIKKIEEKGVELSRPFSVLDHLCERLYMVPTKNAKGMLNELDPVLKSFRSDETFDDMVGVINSYDNDWMARFDAVYPDLTKANRQLVVLLYLGFSMPSITLLTDKKSSSATYTAKSRLKKLLAENTSPEAIEIQTRLGLM